ncbi:MAG TPA: chromosome segregation protein SMC [Vicinamibacterales bacterium]|jgi:chromosome segregation protein|nr:chromosome segregation protein SMC [Vicinamibacterales bacterium]
MRLQRLEISGFKSFPDRSELAFDTGVTAIVGPNGCGKSNVVDAITWVLGEQSARSLRGEHMQDIIFAGSDARKATGAAEVKIRLAGVAARPSTGAPGVAGNGRIRPATLTPAETAVATAAGELLGGEAVALLDEVPLMVRDVEVGRRLYRSGESEYLIDGESVRLKDVQDLLMDAGLGVKAYAVIEQGKIGQILSARPTDRRQLIEEAAGVTKYKSRRRAAELKLEAAQQNLTRVDDIIFEVEKQRGALKRQAAKARRYKRLRDELRRWEKVQFAARYARLGEIIDATRGRLTAAREREAAAAAHLAELETTLERLRLELTEADTKATAAREAAHARELSIGRLQQQVTFDNQQIEILQNAAGALEAEVAALESRREPARLEIESRRGALHTATTDRDAASAALRQQEEAYAVAHRNIEGLEADVEAARSEVYAAVNAATALRHAMDHAGASRARIGEQLAKLDVEGSDLQREAERAAEERAAAQDALRRAREAVEVLRIDRAARESELAVARASRESVGRDLGARERELAGISARLRSLEELDAARAEYGEGARAILAEPDQPIRHDGSVADYLDVDARYERAVDAALGDLLQHVVVPSHEDAEKGLAFVRERDAGRVGFVINEGETTPAEADAAMDDPAVVPVSSVVRISGPAAQAIRAALADVWIASSRDAARAISSRSRAVVATLQGDVYTGAHLIEGGERSEARSILTTKREIKELREKLEQDTTALNRVREEAAGLDVAAAAAESAIASLQQELHRQEKAIVGFELQHTAAGDARDRIARKQEQIAVERRSGEEELRTQERREAEAADSIRRIEAEQRTADDQLSAAQRTLFEARDRAEQQARSTAEAKAAHAALVERASALALEISRLEDAARDLDQRAVARAADLERNVTRREELRAAVAASERQLTADIQEFDNLKEDVRTAEDASLALRTSFDAQELTIRDARRALESVRGEVTQLEIERATAESDLAHLASSCVESVQATLDEVAIEVRQMAQDGVLASPRPVDDGPEAAETEDDPGAAQAIAAEERAGTQSRSLTPDEMVADLRQKIERMGAVNMMAIDQFDDLESRHTFLTAQRKDLVDAIAATNEAIRKIDRTTRERFQEAFTVINGNFEQTFTTLFGGGKAGLVLLDETDALESGIDIIAQPPGKRLQSVQLLSGGEKALTAMALMFAIFKYRPSPFCLLDEIDAPLDDANIGRFVEMLQGMQEHTQFILITHNRKTMEIADRLYGVTMEEPGVSKLISVQLN